jgi:bifunctional non-homologous end joining protein LigD
MRKDGDKKVRPKKKLGTYLDKRNPQRTPEPFHDGKPGERLRFVVHEHHARRHHFDLRLEWNGVLLSFAVPRGIPSEIGVKNLAVHTEDHPLTYLGFEGFIPKGEYGGGDMSIWDRGTFLPLIDPDDGLKDGKLLFELSGEKARGLFTLVHTQPKDGSTNQWLLFKKPDDWAGEHREDTLPAVLGEVQSSGAERAKLMPSDVELMLASSRDNGAFSDPGWIFELKYDGYRLLAAKDGQKTALRYRHGDDVTARFAEISRAMSRLHCGHIVLDGELVALKPDGRTHFHGLEKRAHLDDPRDVEAGIKAVPLTFMAFDLLALEGYDLRSLPLWRRKQWLSMLLRGEKGTIRYTQHIEEDGVGLYEKVVPLGLEGLIAKQRHSRYVGGRSLEWQKIKVLKSDEFAVVGFGLPKRGRAGFSSLLLADEKASVFKGRVGSGFDGETLVAMRDRLDALVRKTPVVEIPKEDQKDTVYVAPKMRVQVRYHSMTDEGRVRHAVFERLRDDKVKEKAKAASPRVSVSNEQKVFFPERGATKGDLVAYYRAIAPFALPYYRERPAMLTRYPDGINGKSFYQKDAPDFIPPWLRTVRIFSDGAQREVDHFVLDDAEALAFVANLGTIPIHVWSSRVDALDRPDYCIIDLDPKTAPFQHVVTIALALRALCEAIELPSYVKTTGSSGLHVLLPLGRVCTYAQSKLLAELLSRVIVSQLPEIATLERDPKRRGGKVYLDCYQNGHGKTIAAAFCVRPVPEASVSMPLSWSQVNKRLTPRQFTMKNALDEIGRRKSDPHAGLLRDAPDLLACLERLKDF